MLAIESLVGSLNSVALKRQFPFEVLKALYNFLENLYQIVFSEFLCETNVDCNQKGTCTDQKCECISGWDSQKGCDSKY